MKIGGFGFRGPFPYFQGNLTKNAHLVNFVGCGVDNWEATNGGGGDVSCDFVGAKLAIERARQNQFWRSQKVGLVWSVPVPF